MKFMHRACKSVSDGEHYVIIVLVVSLVLHSEAVANVRIPRVLVVVVATMTHKSPLVFHYLGFGLVQFCSNCTLRHHPNLRAV